MFILHHYDFSPFSEKIRLAFGIKNLEWRSVQTPLANPKPLLVPLTAGYRRAPVLQVGADVYVDTQLILREIERRAPEPTLYPGGQFGMCAALAAWWERATFLTAASVATSIMGDQIPADFIAERKVLMGRDFSRAASLEMLPGNLQAMTGNMGWLADILGDKPFLLGETVSAADLAAYHTLWFVRGNGGEEAEAMLPLGPLLGWMERVAAFGHGRREEMTAEAAQAAAQAAKPDQMRVPAHAVPGGIEPGTQIAVRMGDMEDVPMRGVLLGADAEKLVLAHEAPEVGTVHIHVPLVGYRVQAIS